ncbi:fimbrial protein [Photobacterium makurazakiensis]|uniref:CS1 type fimbrial major subunit n=1 Tax=Photobacterium makurazakiensis TaxID=2910234 RepID=UPI003D0E8A62
MLNKKTSVLSSLILSALISTGTAHAAAGDKINKVINVNATIPSATFTVAPSYGAWPTDIELPYDADNNTFLTYTIQLEASTSKGLSAQLNQEAALVSGNNKVPLLVKLNERELGPTLTGIVNNTTGAEDPDQQTHIFNLEVGPKPGSYTQTGLYAGVVNMVLEDNF